MLKQFTQIMDERIANATKSPTTGIAFLVKAALHSLPVAVDNKTLQRIVFNYEVAESFKASLQGANGIFHTMTLGELQLRSGLPLMRWLNTYQDNLIHFKINHRIRLHYPSVIAYIKLMRDSKYTQIFKDDIAVKLLQVFGWTLGGRMTRAICAFTPQGCRGSETIQEYCLSKVGI